MNWPSGWIDTASSGCRLKFVFSARVLVMPNFAFGGLGKPSVPSMLRFIACLCRCTAEGVRSPRVFPYL